MGYDKDDRFWPNPSLGEQGLNNGFVPIADIRLLAIVLAFGHFLDAENRVAGR